MSIPKTIKIHNGVIIGEIGVISAIQNIKDMTYFSEEHIHEVVFAYLQGFSEFAQSTYGVNISAGTITDNIMRNLKGVEE